MVKYILLDSKGIPTDKCDIPSNLPQYALEEGETNGKF